MAIILRANKDSSELGGHIASFQSAATLYDIGFGHFWHAADRDARRRPAVHPGSQFARHLRARLSRRPPDRATVAQLPPGSGRQRHPILSASLADAGFLAVPDRLDGPRSVDGDLPGALPQVPAWPRPRRYDAAQGLGVHGRWRDGRARIARRDLAGRPRESRQPGLRHQLQSAAPRRPGARQRQDRSGTGERLPRRRLERHQGALGQRLGRAAREGHAAACCCSAWRSASTASTRTSRARAAPTCASISSASIDETARAGRGHERRRDLGSHARRPRSREGVRRLRRGRQAHRPAHADPGQDGEGLRHGRIGRRAR